MKADDFEFDRSRPVECPECGAWEGHMVDVSVRQDAREVIVDHDGPRLQDCRGSGRGSRVTIGMVGECGHRWHIDFQFHKGSTYCASIPDGAGRLEDTPCLWRD